jgi:hypothetical protein
MLSSFSLWQSNWELSIEKTEIKHNEIASLNFLSMFWT